MLHGLWSPGAGLLLWYPPGTATPPGADIPGLLGSVVRAAQFRHRAEVLLVDGDERWHERVRAHALAPDAAAAALRQRLPSGAVSGDLRFLAHIALGVQRWVHAGRVVPELRRDEGQWWARWRLVGDTGQRVWLAELAAAMPDALRVAGSATAVVADMVTEITDPIARDLVSEQGCAHPLIHGLAVDLPVESGSYQAAETLERWRNTLATDEPELVLRLREPDEAEFGSEPEDALWRLEVCLHTEGAAPAPVSVRDDPHRVRTAVEQLGAAQRAYPRLRDLPEAPDSLDLYLPTEVVADLVAHGAMALSSAGIRLLLPREWNVTAPTLRLRVDSAAPAAESTVGLAGLVSYRWELALGDTVVSQEDMQRLVHAQSDLVRLRDHWVQADHATLAKAAEFVALHSGKAEVALADMFGDIAAAGVAQVPITEVSANGWAAQLLDRDTETESVPVPAGLRTQLRPYQVRGLSWLVTMSRLGCGAILADDMGLGKTVQVLALLLYERENTAGAGPGTTVLVCPMSVVGNWQREADRFAPGLRVLVHHGKDRAKGAQLAAAVAGADLVITTYALLARDSADLARQQWARVVLDEAQHVKNAATRQARAARALPARHRIALTGTPVQNRLEELRSLLDFVAPGLLGSARTFRARFAVPIEREDDQNAITRLHTATAPFVLRRVKTDPAVISDLPDKLEMTVRANLTVEQAALYRAVVDDMLDKLRNAKGMARRGAVLGALTRLKQVCNHPAHYLGDGSAVLRRGGHRSGKLALVEDVLDAVLADREKALLFTQFREFGELIVPYLTERFGTRIPFLHGGVGKKRRDAMIVGFQQQHGPPLMLLSLQAGGTGLNLTAANHVVHLDRWWNPAVENQATDRVFRIGQQRTVQVRRLVCVDTIEERIDELIAGKARLADLAVGAGENWITELSTEELRDLFVLGDEAVGD